MRNSSGPDERWEGETYTCIQGRDGSDRDWMKGGNLSCVVNKHPESNQAVLKQSKVPKEKKLNREVTALAVYSNTENDLCLHFPNKWLHNLNNDVLFKLQRWKGVIFLNYCKTAQGGDWGGFLTLDTTAHVPFPTSTCHWFLWTNPIFPNYN